MQSCNRIVYLVHFDSQFNTAASKRLVGSSLSSTDWANSIESMCSNSILFKQRRVYCMFDALCIKTFYYSLILLLVRSFSQMANNEMLFNLFLFPHMNIMVKSRINWCVHHTHSRHQNIWLELIKIIGNCKTE